MSIPKYNEIYLPFLEFLADGQAHTVNEIIQHLAQGMGLTEEERNERISNDTLTFSNRIVWARIYLVWAITYLSKAGLLHTVKRGALAITDEGKRVLHSKVSSTGEDQPMSSEEASTLPIESESMIEQKERVLSSFKDFQLGLRLRYTDIMRLKKAYEDKFDTTLSLTDDEITELIKNNGFETESNKFSHIDNLLCGTTIAEIEAFIEEQNAIDAKRIWIEPFYNHFRDKLGLAMNANLLVQILLKIGKKKYRVDWDYGFICYNDITLDGQKKEMCKAVANVLGMERTRLTLMEIQQKLPAYTSLSSKRGLRLTDDPHIIELSSGHFIHVNCVYISDEEIGKIKEIIGKEVNEKGHARQTDIQPKLEKVLPSIFDNNRVFGIEGVWKAIASRLVDEYEGNSYVLRKRG